MLDQADANKDGQLARDEFAQLANTWWEKLDADKTGQVAQQLFTERLTTLLPQAQARGGFGPPGGDGGPGRGRGGFGPARFIGPALFAALDTDKDGLTTQAELSQAFSKWFSAWDTNKTGLLDEEAFRAGLAVVLPMPGVGGPMRRDGPSGPGGAGGFGGPGFGPGPGGPGGGGVNLEPLVAANDASKPLLSKLLAVPALRARYLGYVRDMAAKWLDWNRLGPLAQKYHDLIASDVKADTRKLDSYEEFENSLAGGAAEVRGGFGGTSLKSFAEQRRAFLLGHAEIEKLAQ